MSNSVPVQPTHAQPPQPAPTPQCAPVKAFFKKIKNALRFRRHRNVPVVPPVEDAAAPVEEDTVPTSTLATTDPNHPVVDGENNGEENVYEDDNNVVGRYVSSEPQSHQPGTPSPQQVRDAAMAERQAARSRRFRHELNLDYDDKPPKTPPSDFDLDAVVD